MNAKTREILDELFKNDPSMKKNEKEIIQIVEKMVELKPEIKLNENFENELKNKIFSEIFDKKVAKNTSKYEKNSWFFDKIKLFSSFFAWWLIASLAIFVIWVPSVNLDKTSDEKITGIPPLERSNMAKVMMESATVSDLAEENDPFDDELELSFLMADEPEVSNFGVEKNDKREIKKYVYKVGDFDLPELPKKSTIYTFQYEKDGYNTYKNILQEEYNPSEFLSNIESVVSWYNWEEEIAYNREEIVVFDSGKLTYTQLYRGDKVIYVPAIIFETSKKQNDWEYFVKKIVVPLYKEK